MTSRARRTSSSETGSSVTGTSSPRFRHEGVSPPCWYGGTRVPPYAPSLKPHALPTGTLRRAKPAYADSGLPEEQEKRSNQVSVYSGPEPPSGGVSRPPFALIAPHWTQFDGVTSTATVPSPSASPTS